jgi:hypothetical protein
MILNNNLNTDITLIDLKINTPISKKKIQKIQKNL